MPGIITPTYRKEYKCVLKYFFDHYSSTSVVSNFADTFELSAVTNYARYTALFDEFKIDQVEVYITPSVDVSGTSERGVLISAVDINDAYAPSIANLEAQNNSLETNGTIGHYHRFVPSIQNDYAATTPWMNVANATAHWYGLKSSMAVSTSPIYYHYFVRLHVTFRGQSGGS